jgi:hypothetical protein
VEEMRTTYEMPAEAIDWISEMIAYTVAGGKMNRGLSCVSVMRTLAADQGKTFTDRVRMDTYISSVSFNCNLLILFYCFCVRIVFVLVLLAGASSFFRHFSSSRMI